ncbi:hypothetical protein HY041_03015, partial [Candidatus Roizmanbacteria bacterium]|nr:hypothetical protein [Candidatus Roizmanbacteria bacterium]
METTRNPRLSNVLFRLQEFTLGKGEIHRRTEEISKLLHDFRPEKEDLTLTMLKSSHRTLQDYQHVDKKAGKEVSSFFRERFENATVAYLLYQMKKKYEAENKPFDIRTDQIEAIVALLSENHLQAPTGAGKSSAILPITAVVKAISTQEDIAVATVSPELIAVLEKNVLQVNNLLPHFLRTDLFRCEAKTTQETWREKEDDIVHALLDEALSGKKSEKVEEYHFRSLFNQAPSDRYAFEPIDEQKKRRASEISSHGTVRLFTDDQLIFWKMMNPEKKLTHTYFDEIHVPYDRKTPFVLEETGIMTKQQVEGYLFRRVTTGIIAEYVELWEKQGFIQLKAGKYAFIDEKNSEAFESVIQNVLFTTQEDALKQKALGIVAEKLGVDNNLLKNWFSKFITSFGEEEVLSENRTWTQILLNAKSIKEGVHYSRRGGKIVSRDFMMGLGLPDREYEPEIAVALQAINGIASFVSDQKTSTKSTTFQGFVSEYLHGKISGLSGTLKTPSLTYPYSPKKTPLAYFLEKYTHKDTHVIKEKEHKIPPRPQYYLQHADLQKKVIDIVQTNQYRSAAIHCFSESEGKQLFDILSSSFQNNKEKIFFINDEMTESKAQAICQQFADTENGVLISTGRVGVGVDIKKSDGSFPDFVSLIDGVPFAAAQLYQIMGRRRRISKNPDADFYWFFSKEQVKQHSGYAAKDEKEQKELKILEGLESLAEDLLQEDIKSANNDLNTAFALEKHKDAVLKIIARLVRRAENQQSMSDDLIVSKDLFYLTLWEETKVRLEKQRKDILDVSQELPYEEVPLLQKHIRTKFFLDLLKTTDRNFFFNLLSVPGSLYHSMDFDFDMSFRVPPINPAYGYYTQKDIMQAYFAEFQENAISNINDENIS